MIIISMWGVLGGGEGWFADDIGQAGSPDHLLRDYHRRRLGSVLSFELLEHAGLDCHGLLGQDGDDGPFPPRA